MLAARPDDDLTLAAPDCQPEAGLLSIEIGR
jgi:hypothetical protein